MKNQKTLLALALCLIGVSAFADDQAKPFSYRVEVPAGASGCETHASSVAQLFSQATGMAVDNSTCTQETFTDNGASFTKDVIIINYHSTTGQVLPYRAVMGGDVYMSQSSDYSGLFSSYADCVSALPEQTKDFANFTGLTAVSGHCDSPSDSTGSGFVLTVEGFGTPAMRLFAFQKQNDPFGPTSSPEVMAAVRQIIINAHGMINYADATRIFYYGNQPASLTVTEPEDFNISSDCTSQLEDAKAIYTKGGFTDVQAFCLANSDTSTVTGHLAIVGAGGALVESDIGENSAHYVDFASCQADKARVLQNALSSGAKALGGLCRPEGVQAEYRLDMFVSSF